MSDNFATARRSMLEFMSGVLDSIFSDSTAGLKWNLRNSKLNDIPAISLPAGHSCPFAKDCRSCAIRNPNFGPLDSRKFVIQDGEHTDFRCYTAIDEVMRPTVRKARWHNYLLISDAIPRGVKAVADLIDKSLPQGKFAPKRAHVAGDFFHLVYFDAWLEVARRHPNQIFYAYTKALPFWVKRLGTIPANFRLTASYGGTHDHLIAEYGLRSVKVVASVEEANALGLEIDHDDSHAYGTGGDFALLVHGQQPKGSRMAKAWSALKKLGLGGYGNQKASLIAGTSKRQSAGGTAPVPAAA